MTTILWLIILAAGICVLGYLRLRLLPSTLLAAALLGLAQLALQPPMAAATAVWAVFALAALLINIPAVRRPVLSAPVFAIFRRIMPPLSDTEREALEAGSVWWDGELFSGRPDWGKLLAVPPPHLAPHERAFVDGPVEELCRRLDDWRITHHDLDLPPEIWRYIKEQGFFGMIIPKEYGGLEFSALAHSAVVTKLASRSVTAAVSVMVPNSLGPAELLLHYGTDEQKNHFLPRLARGEEVPCFALTGPEAGSDAGSIPDTGVVCRGLFQGKEIVGIRLNWDKRYITLGPVATILGLAFKLYDPDHLLGEREALGITCALIPTNTPGVEIGARHFPLNIPFQNGPTWGRDVFIPLDWIIGGPKRAGQGWRMLMECLAAGRSISLPALSTGATKLVSRGTGAYARVRRQFKMPIGFFGGVEEALARIGGHTYVVDAVRTLTAYAVDKGEKPSVLSAIAKYNLTERMRMVVSDGMDVQGGSGICLGPRNFLGRAYQSVPISITVEGANILTRSMIIFGQGAIRCHPFVLQELQAVGNPDAAQGLRNFDRAFFGHIGFTFSNALRAFVLGLTGARLACAPSQANCERRYYRQLGRMSAALALSADMAMLTLGGSLKRLEKISGRLADVLSQLYLASAALKRYADQNRPEADWPLVAWACEDALYRAQQAFVGLLQNFPNRPAAWLMRALIFPLGLPYRPPGDKLGHAVAQVLLNPGEARDRLTRGIFLPQELSEPLGRLDEALRLAVAAEVIERTLNKAVKQGRLKPEPQAQSRQDMEQLIPQAVAAGILSAADAQTLEAAARLRREVIRVDHFSNEELRTGVVKETRILKEGT